MTIHTITKFIYGFFGVVFLVIGLSVVMYSTGIVPPGTQDIILHAADNSLNGLHSLQEFGSLLVFAGLISFWFIRHYEQSMGFHWAMTVFWALMALVHWTDIRGLRPSLMGPMLNTVPVVLFAIIGFWRYRKNRNATT